MVAGVVLNGVATGLYIGAGMGPGPRDGLHDRHRRTRRHSIRVVRTSIDIDALLLGWPRRLVGVGTVLYALAIGPIAHITIPVFTIGKVRVVPRDDLHGN